MAQKIKNGRKGVWMDRGNWEVCGFWGEVHAKTPGLYQDPNWIYSQKTRKKQRKGGLGGSGGGPPKKM